MARTTRDAGKQIVEGSRHAAKTFSFTEQDPTRLVNWWFQDAPEGLVLFAVFYSLACRWNRCQACNLPATSSLTPVGWRDLVRQVDRLLAEDAVRTRLPDIRKVIASNNGSLLDQVTFPTTALMYLLARLNIDLPAMRMLSIETRPEYVDWEELELLSRALRDREPPADLEVAVGFEAFDDRIRNEVFGKGLTLDVFERLVEMVGRHGYGLKCYFMLKPVVGLTDDEAVADVHRALDYLDGLARRHGARMNLHLNPTYVAGGTPLEVAFRAGSYRPPSLADVARAARHARGKKLTVFLGLYDEGLAVPGGSFLEPGDEPVVARLEQFNRTQDFALLDLG